MLLMRRAALMAFLMLFTFWVRAPAIPAGLPYFYNEDEAHHFNRTVNMVKSGEFNPRYFHKPSLHFYLRMPVVAAAFLWNVKKGSIRSLKELVTTDQEGLAGYAFSASHPGIVKWNRAFSVLLGSLTVLLAFLIVEELTGRTAVAAGAALLSSLSPALLEHGATIGVDVVMDFFCLLASYLSLRFWKTERYSFLLSAAVAAGFAVSSKYNALPIVLVPAVAALLRREHSRMMPAVQALSISIAAFFAGSPYILKELPTFLDQLAYEIWHYGIAGHEGHTGEPGIGQTLFYIKWLARDSFGVLPLLTAFLGLILSSRYGRRRSAVIFLFPILFFLLMIAQRANFTRNMLVVIPYASIAAGIFIARTFQGRNLVLASFAVLMSQPVWQTLSVRKEISRIPESRVSLEHELETHPKTETAVTALLECAPSCFRHPGVSEVPKSDDPISVYMKGYDRFVSTSAQAALPFLKLDAELPGSSELQRIVRNPAMKIWSFLEDKVATEDKNRYLESERSHRVTLTRSGEAFSCSTGGEDYCWSDQRVMRIYIEGLRDDPNFFGKDGVVPFEMTAYTPWENQKARVTFDDFLAYIDLPHIRPGELQTFTVDMPYQELKSQGYFILTLSDVHAPMQWVGGEDSRRLGLAIKSIRILPR